jgi:hypothetical protein
MRPFSLFGLLSFTFKLLSPQGEILSFASPKEVSKEKATLAAVKARSTKCVQGDSATRSSRQLPAQTLLVLKPWPPIFEQFAAKG